MFTSLTAVAAVTVGTCAYIVSHTHSTISALGIACSWKNANIDSARDVLNFFSQRGVGVFLNRNASVWMGTKKGSQCSPS